MSSTDLIKFVAEENHVKFRSTLNNLLYSKLSEGISEKTFETLSGIFASDIMEGKKPDFLDMDKDGNKKESMKKALKDKKKKTMKEAKEDKDEKDDDEDEDEDEDEDDEEEDDEEEDDEEEEEEDEEEETAKKGGKTFHFDINSHNKGKKK